jgi:hypothetical protein
MFLGVQILGKQTWEAVGDGKDGVKQGESFAMEGVGWMPGGQGLVARAEATLAEGWRSDETPLAGSYSI